MTCSITCSTSPCFHSFSFGNKYKNTFYVVQSIVIYYTISVLPTYVFSDLFYVKLEEKDVSKYNKGDGPQEKK